MNRLKMTLKLTVLAADNVPATYLRKAIRGHIYQLATDEANAKITMNFMYGIEDIDGPYDIESI
jgi:hypothetical protein